MNKNFILVVSVGFVVVLLFASTIAAFSWNDLFTGRAVQSTGEAKINPSQWEESDGGNNPEQAGAIYTGNRVYSDFCKNDRFLNEYVIKEDKVRARNIKCDFGCESVELLFHGQTSLTGQCKAAPEGNCEEIGDVGNDPFTPGVVVVTNNQNVRSYKDDNAVGNEDGSKGKLLMEYSCDENNQLVKESFKCNGVIKTQEIDVSGEMRTASYCEIQPITCTKEGKQLTYTKANGESNKKNDKCMTGQGAGVGEEGSSAQLSAGSIVKFYCTIDEFDVDGDGDVDMNDANSPEVDTALAPGERQRILDFIELGRPFERVVSVCGLPGCSVSETEVMCNNPTCIESDDRIDKDVVGTTNVSAWAATDTCIGADRVLEYWCPTAISTFISAKDLPCGEGRVCNAGVCI